MRMVRSVPPGGNWKNIPETVPSRRLDQIRESYARGEGSRSTYYGRLKPDSPAYTINTYFSRPGNGCHIHYSQDRVLSQREAARLQGFPDHFVFEGGQGAVATQIGNAVPPLLAYQIAKSLGPPGDYVDLFAGAGGMGLGFKLAGWRPIVANDVRSIFLKTYARNVHPRVVCGSISDPSIFDSIVGVARSRRQDVPLWVVGGPPCQGFSTAGSRRSESDPRNKLVWDYVRFLDAVRPDGFVFENVTGLLSMGKGAIFESLKDKLEQFAPAVSAHVVSAVNYGVPQRRKRVIIVGQDGSPWLAPLPITHLRTAEGSTEHHVPAISVAEALSDLPPIGAGEDGSMLQYISAPMGAYQELMRGGLTVNEYFSKIQSSKTTGRPR